MRVGLAIVSVWVLASVTALTAGARTPPSRCAAAWNRTAPETLRTRIVASKPRGAFIDSHGSAVTSVTWTKTSHSSSSAPGCSIQFVLHNGHTLAVWGAWDGAGVSRWLGPVPSNRAIPLPTNTNVHADGTVDFHG